MKNKFIENLKDLEYDITTLRNFITAEEEKTDFNMYNIYTPEFLDSFKLKVSYVDDDLLAIKRELTPENIKYAIVNNNDSYYADDINGFFDYLLYQIFTVQSTVNSIKHRLVTEDRYYQMNLDKIIPLTFFNYVDNRLTNLLYEILTYKEPLNKLEVFKEKYERLGL